MKAGIRDRGPGISNKVVKRKIGSQKPAQPLAAVGASLIEHETLAF